MALEPEEHFKTPEWVSRLENKHKKVRTYLQYFRYLKSSILLGIFLFNKIITACFCTRTIIYKFKMNFIFLYQSTVLDSNLRT